MNALSCHKVMDTFFSLDKNQRLPLRVTAHLLVCKKCHTQVRLCTMAEQVCAESLRQPLPAGSDIAAGIMSRIAEHDELSNAKPLTMRRWIFSGVAMIIALLAFCLSTTAATDPRLLVSFYLLFGGIVTAYCALFIGSNLDFFIKKIETLKPPSAPAYKNAPAN